MPAWEKMRKTNVQQHALTPSTRTQKYGRGAGHDQERIILFDEGLLVPPLGRGRYKVRGNAASNMAPVSYEGARAGLRPSLQGRTSKEMPETRTDRNSTSRSPFWLQRNFLKIFAFPARHPRRSGHTWHARPGGRTEQQPPAARAPSADSLALQHADL